MLNSLKLDLDQQGQDPVDLPVWEDLDRVDLPEQYKELLDPLDLQVGPWVRVGQVVLVLVDQGE